jgi:hypothetical protein
MLTDQQLAIAVAGVCVLAVMLLVLARRRRVSADRATSTVDADRLVLARTHDGTHYQGAFVDMGGPGEFLTLAGPIVFRRVGAEPETMPPVWDRLTLPLADVAEVWTRSTPAAPAPAKGREPSATEPAPTPADEAAANLLRAVSEDDRTPEIDAGVDENPVAQRRHERRGRRSPTTTP